MIILSKRENEVLELVKLGKSNKQIASELKISYRTVELHRRNILRKTGAANMCAAIVLCTNNDVDIKNLSGRWKRKETNNE